MNPEIFCLRAMEPGTVLEVKYDAFLPELVRMAVQVPEGRRRPAPNTPCAGGLIKII